MQSQRSRRTTAPGPQPGEDKSPRETRSQALGILQRESAQDNTTSSHEQIITLCRERLKAPQTNLYDYRKGMELQKTILDLLGQEMAHLHATVGDFTSKADRLEVHKLNLEARLQKQTERVDELNTQLENMKDKTQSTQESVKAWEEANAEAVRKSKEERDNLQARISKLNKENDKLNTEVEQRNEHAESLTTQLQDMKDESQKAQAMHKAKEEAHAEIVRKDNNEKGRLQERILQLETENGKFKKEVQQQVLDANSLTIQLERVKQENSQLSIAKTSFDQREIEALSQSQQLASLREQVAKLRTENEQLKGRADEQHANATALERELDELRQESDRLRTSSQSTSMEVTARGLETNSLQRQLQDLQNQLTGLEQQLHDSKSKYRSTSLSLSEEKTKNEKVREELSESNEKKKSLESDLVDERNTIRDLTKKISQMTEDSRQLLEEAKTKLRDQMMAEEITCRDRDIRELNEQCQRRASRINDLTADLARAVEANGSFKKELEEIQREREESMRARELEKSQQYLSQTQRDESFTKQIHTLQSEQRDKDRKIADLEGRLQESAESQEKGKKIIEALRRESHEASVRLQQQREKIKDLETQREEVKSKMEQQETQIKHLSTARYGTESEQAKSLENNRNNELISLKSTVGVLERKLMDVQEFGFLLRKIAAQGKADDGDIRNRLEYEFRAGTRTWAREWASRAFDSGFDTSINVSELRREIEKVAKLKKDASLQQQLQTFHPRLMVDALLSRYLVDQIFLSPSPRSGEDEENEGLSMESALSKSLMELYKAFIHVDETRAHSWRSQTFSLFRASKLTSLENRTSTSRLPTDVTKLAENFLTGPVQLFLQPVHNSERQKRLQQLVQLIRDTVDLSTYIRQQQTLPEIRGFEVYGAQHFTHDSSEMEPDRSQRIDPGDAHRDGESIQMVVKPGFFVAQQDNRDEKVWAKAVVLLP